MTLAKFLRYLIIGGLFLTPFIVLIVSDFRNGESVLALFFPFISGKNFAFRIIIEIIFGSWIILAILDPKYRPRPSMILWSILIFLGVITIADINSVYPYKSIWSNFERMEGLVGMLHLGAFFLVASSVLKSEKLWRNFFHTSIGVSIFIGLHALLQVGNEIVINQGNLRVDSTLGNAIYLAIYMLFHFFILAFYALRREEKAILHVTSSGIIGFSLFTLYYLVRISSKAHEAGKVGIILLIISILGLGLLIYIRYLSSKKGFSRLAQILYTLIALFSVVIIVYTATRGVLLGLAGAIGMFAIITLILKHRETFYKKLGIGIIAALIVITGTLYLFKDRPFIENRPILSRITSISFTNDDAEARLRVWNTAIKGFKEKPILGWGQESFNYVFNKYYDPQLYNREQWFDRVHNIVLDWLIAGGILGLLSYLSILAALIYLIWKKSPIDTDGGNFSITEKAVLTSIIAGYFVQNFIVFDNITSYILFFSVLSYVHFRKTQSLPDGDFYKKEINNTAVKTIFTPIIAVLVIIAIVFINGRPIIAGASLIQAIRAHKEGPTKNLDLFKSALELDTFASAEIREQLAQVSSQLPGLNVDDDIKIAFYELAFSELKKQIELAPDDARYHLFLGNFLGRVGAYDEALVYLNNGLKLSQHKQAIYFEIANAYLNRGSFQEALQTAKFAYDLAPEFQEALVIYALTAVYAGEFDLARDLIINENTGIITDNRLNSAYFNVGNNREMLKIWQEVLATDPNNPSYLIYYSGALLQNERPRESIAAIKKAIELDPTLKENYEQVIQRIQNGERDLRIRTP